MKDLLKKTKELDASLNNPEVKFVIKYAVIGALDCVFDFFLYTFLTRGFLYWRRHYLLANMISFLTSDCATFDIGRQWVFHLPILPLDEEEAKKLNLNLTPQEEKIIHIQYFKFLFVSIAGFIVNQSGLFICVSLLKVNDLGAKIFMGIFVGVVRLGTHRLWTFKVNRNNKSMKQ